MEYFCGNVIVTNSGGVWKVTRKYKKVSADGPWYDATNLVTGRMCKIQLTNIDKTQTEKINEDKQRLKLVISLGDTRPWP